MNDPAERLFVTKSLRRGKRRKLEMKGERGGSYKKEQHTQGVTGGGERGWYIQTFPDQVVKGGRKKAKKGGTRGKRPKKCPSRKKKPTSHSTRRRITKRKTVPSKNICNSTLCTRRKKKRSQKNARGQGPTRDGTKRTLRWQAFRGGKGEKTNDPRRGMGGGWRNRGRGGVCENPRVK